MRELILLLALTLVSCQTASTNDADARAADREKIKSELEVSLKSDREQLSELRKEIPEDKQKSNDEMALFLSLMKQGTEPNLVREKFSSIVSKKRTSFRAKVTRLREDFRKEETRKREDFLKEHKTRREDFAKSKHDQKANREFFSEQDKLRQRYFADERDRRQSFESELNAQSKDFESYMRERTNEFNEQYRLYSKQFSEKPKEKKAVTGEAGGFDKLKNMDASPLGTGP